MSNKHNNTSKPNQANKLQLLASSLFAALLCLLIGCSTSQKATPNTPSESSTPHLEATPSATSEAKATSSAPTQRLPLTYAQQQHYNALFLEAIRQKQADHIDAQFELLNEALRLNPEASEAIYEMGILCLSYTAYSDTLMRHRGDSLLHRAVELEPRNLYYKETLATHLANTAHYAEAIALFEEIAEANPSADPLNTLVWLYKNNADYGGVIRTLNRIEQIEGTSEQLSLEKFQTYIALKDDEHAYKAIEDLCAEYPYDLRYRVLMGDLYDQQGHHEQALMTYRDVLSAEPDNSYAQISLLAYYKAAAADSLYLDLLHRVVLNPHTQSGARLEAMRGYVVDNIRQEADTLPVIQLFSQALAMPQESSNIAQLQVSYLTERGLSPQRIAQALRTVLRIEPDQTQARLHLLLLNIQQEQSMDTIAHICAEGQLYDPTEVCFYYYHGIALYRLGRNAEAISQLQQGAERITPDTDQQTASELYALLGDVLHATGQKSEAYQAYERSLEVKANNTECLNNYAYFLSVDAESLPLTTQRAELLKKAERMSRLTVEAEGANPTFLDTYAWILHLNHQPKQALIYINEALDLTPQPTAEDATLYDHAGDILYTNNQLKPALQQWRKALQLTNDAKLKRKLNLKLKRRKP